VNSEFNELEDFDSNTPVHAHVIYPEISRLKRKQSVHGKTVFVIIIAVIIALIAGGILIYKAADALYFSVEKGEQQTQANLNRSIDYGFPTLVDVYNYSDTDLLSYLQDTCGYSLYFYSSEGDYPDGGFDVLKIPSDVTADEANELLYNGISKLDKVEASKILNGSYRFTVDFSSYTDMRIRYADFASSSITDAIDKAQASQKLNDENSTVSEDGVDTYGNTYRTGSYTKESTNIEWRISAISLSDIYDISGLPEDAIYVSVRITC
jgi:hypothetical protein